MSINATLGSKSRVRRTIIELKWFSMICFAGKNKEACFMHARVAMYSQLSTRFLLKGVIYDLSVIHIVRLSHTETNKRLLIIILLAFRERDKPNWSLLWQRVLRCFVIMQVGIFDVTLWEGTVLLNFRILNTYPYDIVIKYGAYCQTRTNHLEDLEKTEVKRSSWEEIEKT